MNDSLSLTIRDREHSPATDHRGQRLLEAMIDLDVPMPAQVEAALLYSAINESDEGVAVIDVSGEAPVIKFANVRFEELYGLDQSADSPPAAASASVRSVERFFVSPEVVTLKQGAVLRLHTSVTRDDGTTVPVDTEIQALHGGDGLILVRWRDASGRLADESAKSQARSADDLLVERERVAGHVRHTVIQRLFATGLMLSSGASRTADPELTERLIDAVEQIDEAIRELRAVIFPSSAVFG